jgi:hypothetical protein
MGGGVQACGALAEHLLFGEELLVDFETDPEPDLFVVYGFLQGDSSI